MDRFRLRLPARVNLLGNPGDAVEGDFATLTAAVEPYARARIGPDATYRLEQAGEGAAALDFRPADLPLPYDGRLDLLKGALNRLHAFSPELRAKLPAGGFHLRVRSAVPRQSGLGGSSLLVLLALAALRAAYALDPAGHNDYLLAELCQRVEEGELGITAGFADRYAPLFGGLAYIDYRGKLAHAPLGEEPLATYERLEARAAPLPLVAVSSGVRHESGDVHGRMRPRYLEEHAAWEARGGAMPPMVRLMTAAWETAWRGKLAVLRGDLPAFGALMDENHRLVDEMMRYCGFEDGAGWANNALIRAAREAGALGAKLTGAGGGGSVFALAAPGAEAAVLSAWERAAAAHGLDGARLFPLTIVPRGLRVEREG